MDILVDLHYDENNYHYLSKFRLPMKVVSSIGSMKNRSPDCQVVKRRGYIFVICKSNPRLKVRQGSKQKKRKIN